MIEVVAIRHMILILILLHEIAVVGELAFGCLQAANAPADVTDLWLAQHVLHLAGLLLWFEIRIVWLWTLVKSFLVLFAGWAEGVGVRASLPHRRIRTVMTTMLLQHLQILHVSLDAFIGHVLGLEA